MCKECLMVRKKMDEEKSRSSTLGWVQVAATVFLGVVGVVFTFTSSYQQEKNRNTMMATQLMSDREKSETSFRQGMFQPLIDKILDEKLPLKKRFMIFKVFQNNFNDLFNSRALFDVLEEAAKDEAEENPEISKEILMELTSLARKTTQSQELLISGEQIIIDISVGVPFDTIFQKAENDHHSNTNDGASHTIKIEVDSVTENHVNVRVTLNPDEKNSVKLNNGEPFEVSYFDSPLTDNILLKDKHRLAITLQGVSPDSHPPMAKLKIIHFPADFITTGYRPSVDQVKGIIGDNH